MRRDKQGKVIDSMWERFKSWNLGRKLRQGKLPRGRITSKQASDAFALGCPSNAIEGFGILSAKVIRGNQVDDLGVICVRKITTAFRDYVVDSLQNSTTSPLDDFKFHAAGTGVVAEANTDTTLGTEIESRVSGTQLEGASANIYKTVATIPFTGTHAVTEHGVLSAASAGTLMDRSVFSAINVVNTDTIEFTYEATFNAEA